MNQAVFLSENLYTPIAEDLRKVRRAFDQELQSDLPFLEELCAHIGQYRGKMLRPALTLLSARACGEVTSQHITVAAVLEMVHMATLIHDDVLDDADMRRQQQTVHSMTNNETAVLLGDYLISHAYHLCSSLDSQYASRTIASCTNTTCEGELLQVHNRNNWNLTQDEYLTIISRKTAALTSAACMLGAKFAGADPTITQAMESYGFELGVAFQIADDVLDVVGTQQKLGKTLGSDWAKGKATLPVIHFLSGADDAAKRDLRKLADGSSNSNQTQIRELLNGAIDSAMDVAREHVQIALKGLEHLEPSACRESLAAMVEFTVQRSF